MVNGVFGKYDLANDRKCKYSNIIDLPDIHQASMVETFSDLIWLNAV
jgi:hypothetical protein